MITKSCEMRLDTLNRSLVEVFSQLDEEKEYTSMNESSM